MTRFILATFVVALTAPPALACDDHHGVCEIEDWRYSYTSMMKALSIDGVATCDAGVIRLRLYDGIGDQREFIGVETAHIDGHIFEAILLPIEVKPTDLSIKYSVEPR
ncbi:MAG: hypothetical protein OXL68_15205 [Paracoccaceae bacterium]|nr:hypothetical protein [Paracoccaceae bacterium]